MSALAPLMTSTGPLLDRASAGVRALMNAVSRREGEYFDEGHYSASQVKKELQEASVDCKIRALKRLLAAYASGVDVSALLPEVVKAIAVPSLELKRLVYLFLVLHAETSRDVALLSINSFQKDLADRNQIIRATALKALASIHLLEVVQLLMASLRRAAADSSPFVRRTAAQCVMKVFTLDPDQYQDLQKIVLALLKDVEISVVGAALVAFRELCIRHGAADCLRSHEAYSMSPPSSSSTPQQQQQQSEYVNLPSSSSFFDDHTRQQSRNMGEYLHSTHQCMQTTPTSGCFAQNADSQIEYMAMRVHGDHHHDAGPHKAETYTEQNVGDMFHEYTAEQRRPQQSRWQYGKEGGGRCNRESGSGLYDAAIAANDDAAATGASTTTTTIRHSANSIMLNGRYITMENPVKPFNASATTTKLKRSFKAQACALALLHPHYRRLQESVLQLEPFAQVVAVDIFLRYTRLFFADPSVAFRKRKLQCEEEKKLQQSKTQNVQQPRETLRDSQYRGYSMRSQWRQILPFDSSPSSNDARRSGDFSGSSGDGVLTYGKMIEESNANPLSPDLRVFLSNLGQLLYSESVAVIAAVASAFYHILPAAAWEPLVHPLLRCVHTSPAEFQEPLLHIIAALAAAAPSLFMRHFRSFFLAYNDPPCVKQGKLLVLRRLVFSPRFRFAAATGAASEEIATLPSLLLQELCTYIRWPGDPLLLSTCFNFLVNIALRFPSAQSVCMQKFIQLLDMPASCTLASEAILGLQVLLQHQQQQAQPQQKWQQQQQRPQMEGNHMAADGNVVDATKWTSNKKVSFRGSELVKKKHPGGRQQLGWLVLQLAMHLSRVIQGAAARASIVWIVGEYQREVGWVAADIFRQLVSSFKVEPGEVKLQILLLGLKVWALHWDNKQLLKQRQQSSLSCKPRAEGVSKTMTVAVAAPAPPETSEKGGPRGKEKQDEDRIEEGLLLQNGIIPTAVSARKGVAVDGKLQQQHQHQNQHQQRQQEHAEAVKGQWKNEGIAGGGTHQEKQRPDIVEESHLLPPPTPEESAAAFPRLDKMLKYVCEAASFDASYDVRDMARYYFALSRLALASERDPCICQSHRNVEGRENSSAALSSDDHQHRTHSNDSSSNGTTCRVSGMNVKNSNFDSTWTTTHSLSDTRSFEDVSTMATAAAGAPGEKGNVAFQVVEEGLAGCGGRMMFTNSSAKAFADMSHFAQEYMRTLAKGSSARADTSKVRRQQHNREVVHSFGGASARTAASESAGHSEFLEKKRPENTCDIFTSEQEEHAGWNSTAVSLSGESRKTGSFRTSSGVEDSNSGPRSAAAEDLRAESCLWEEQGARRGSADQSSALLLGSLSELLGERMSGYVDIPPFAAEDSSDELRRVEQLTVAPELAQCLMRGSAAAAASGDRSKTLLFSSPHYMNLHEVKAISADDIVVKRSAAALMGRDINVKAEFTSLDLDFFYADDNVPNNGHPGTSILPAQQGMLDNPSAAVHPRTALTPTSASNTRGDVPENTTYFAFGSNTVTDSVLKGQREEHVQQQHHQSVWDMFGEAHTPQINNGEGIVQQQQQTNAGPSTSRYDDDARTGYFTVDKVLEARRGNLMAAQARTRGEGGEAVVGEDEESDEERSFTEQMPSHKT